MNARTVSAGCGQPAGSSRRIWPLTGRTGSARDAGELAGPGAVGQHDRSARRARVPSASVDPGDPVRPAAARACTKPVTCSDPGRRAAAISARQQQPVVAAPVACDQQPAADRRGRAAARRGGPRGWSAARRLSPSRSRKSASAVSRASVVGVVGDREGRRPAQPGGQPAGLLDLGGEAGVALAARPGSVRAAACSVNVVSVTGASMPAATRRRGGRALADDQSTPTGRPAPAARRSQCRSARRRRRPRRCAQQHSPSSHTDQSRGARGPAPEGPEDEHGQKRPRGPAAEGCGSDHWVKNGPSDRPAGVRK